MRRLVSILAVLLVCCSASAQSGRWADWQYYETPMQFTPIVFDLGAEYLGIQPSRGVVDRCVALTVGYGSMFLMVQGLKYFVSEQRPDGTNDHSFPSGHTAAAITGAELIRQDYGWGWGALFYACGGAVAYGRVVHKRHWWWDTAAGAVVGIFSAGIGDWVADALDLSGRLGWGGLDEANVAFAPAIDPFNGTYCASVVWRF